MFRVSIKGRTERDGNYPERGSPLASRARQRWSNQSVFGVGVMTNIPRQLTEFSVPVIKYLS